MISTLAKQLSRDLQAAFKDGPPAPLQLEQIIAAAVKRLNLVPRDEFDAQTAVLQRSRAKIDAMEKQIEEMLRAVTVLQSQQDKTDT